MDFLIGMFVGSFFTIVAWVQYKDYQDKKKEKWHLPQTFFNSDECTICGKKVNEH